MAGFTDRPFRQLCKDFGADVMISEFVHAEKFLDARSAEDAWHTVDFSPGQRPMGIQIFGGRPERMAEAAQRIADRLQPDFIDINYGCPAPKVVENCCGSSLLREPALLTAIAASVVDRLRGQLPVTAKIRIGWDGDSINAVDIARRLEDVGISAITVHGRTKEQGYRGDANWQVIAAVASAVRIPVIGNGSTGNHAATLAAARASGVKALMIGRAALGNPWIFRQLHHYQSHAEWPAEPTAHERWQVLLRYVNDLLAFKEQSPWQTVAWMRPRMKSFARDFPGCKRLRAAIEAVTSVEQLHALAGMLGEADSELADGNTFSSVNP